MWVSCATFLSQRGPDIKGGSDTTTLLSKAIMTEELKEKEPIPEPETTEESSTSKVDRVEELEAQQVKDEQDADAAANKTSTEETGAGEQGKETPPPMPPRPQSPFTRAQSQLQEAFPSIEPNVIRAVLVASGGKLDPAFNALLSMSDPDFKPDEALQAAAGGGGGVNQSQLEQDEALARQLAEQEDRRRGGRGHPPPPPNPRYTSSRVRSSQDTAGSGYSGRYDDQRGYPPPPERSFFDDDLPEIRENIQKGFNDTRDKFNSWMTNLRKKIDNEEEQGGGGGGLFGALGGNGSGSNRSSAEGTRPAGYGYSSARTRRYYDRDPDEISSDFQGISLRDDENPPAKPSRPQQQSRQVSALGETQPSSGGSKWEPLKTTSDKQEEEKDPFFIGESDDDDDNTNTNQSSSAKKD